MPVFKRLVLLTLLCYFVAPTVFAQQTESPAPADSTAPPSTPTVTDEAQPISKIKRLQNHSPRRTLFRALVLPGWGQISNRQIWKLPIVYAGLGGMTWVSIQASQNHKLYTRAFQYKAWEEQTPEDGEHPFPEFEDEYLEVLESRGCTGTCTINSSNLKPLRDNFRRNRDLSRFGIGLIYGLTVIDAFVSAHLLDFDVSEDLTAQILPHPNGPTALIRISF